MKPNLVYLDQNQWIFLGRAYHNRSGAKKYSAILEKIQLAAQAQSSLFPLSSAHFIETGKRRDPNSRQRQAHVMAEISQRWMLAPPDYLVPSQLRVVIADVFNKRKLPWPLALGRGVAFAFGKHETMHVKLEISFKEDSRLQEISARPEELIKFLVGRDELIGVEQQKTLIKVLIGMPKVSSICGLLANPLARQSANVLMLLT